MIIIYLVIRLLLTINCSLFTINYSLLTINYSLSPVVFFNQEIICRPLVASQSQHKYNRHQVE